MTKKTGKSRGFAYVEFDNKDQASKGLKLDGVELKGRKLSVAISNPKDREHEEREEKELQFGVSKKPATSLMPRQMAIKKQKEDSTSHSNSTTATKLSNDDFRKMMFK